MSLSRGEAEGDEGELVEEGEEQRDEEGEEEGEVEREAYSPWSVSAQKELRETRGFSELLSLMSMLNSGEPFWFVKRTRSSELLETC